MQDVSHVHEKSWREPPEALCFLTYLDKTNLSIRHSDQSDEGKNLSVHNYTVRTAKSLQLVFAQKAFVLGSCLDKVWIRYFSNLTNFHELATKIISLFFLFLFY